MKPESERIFEAWLLLAATLLMLAAVAAAWVAL